MTRPGELDRRVVIEAAQLTGDGAGGDDAVWTPVASVWAKVRPHLRDETVAGDAVAAGVTHLVTIRYRRDVDPSKRLRLGSAILDILSVVDAGDARRWLVCRCAQKSAP